jgi:hypothetical protein
MKHAFGLIISCLMAVSGFTQKRNFTQQQLDEANTAALTTQLDVLEKEVVMYINLARLYPKQFFYVYADSMANMAGIDPSNSNFISLKSTLLKDKKSTALMPDDNLLKMAKDMQNDVGPKGIVGHTNSKKKNFAKRAALFNLKGYCAENIDYGRNSALEIVFSWLFDIDVESLGHRENLLNPLYTKVGIKYGPHKKYSYCCVLDLADK